MKFQIPPLDYFFIVVYSYTREAGERMGEKEPLLFVCHDLFSSCYMAVIKVAISGNIVQIYGHQRLCNVN